jgi:hypothetical protein
MSVVAVMAAPRASTGARVSMSAPTRSSSSGSTTTTPTVGAAGGRGGHDDHEDHDDDEFGLDDIAGGFAFRAYGFVAFGGPGSAVPVVPGTGVGGTPAIPTEPTQLWVVVEGRTCSDKKGRCAINAWVNINGFQTFHIDTRLASGAGIADCQVTVDEFGQGTMVIPIQFTTDGGAAIPIAGMIGAFPTLLTVRFQAFDRDNTYFEIEGCGVAGSPTFGTPPTGGSFQNVCSPPSLVTQGRIPLALTGRASRIQFRCTNCKKDDFVIAGDCVDEDICPAGFGNNGGHGGGRRNGPGAFGNSGSLDL